MAARVCVEPGYETRGARARVDVDRQFRDAPGSRRRGLERLCEAGGVVVAARLDGLVPEQNRPGCAQRPGSRQGERHHGENHGNERRLYAPVHRPIVTDARGDGNTRSCRESAFGSDEIPP